MRHLSTIYRCCLNGILNAVFASYASAKPANVMDTIFLRSLAFIFVVAVSPTLAADASEKVAYSPIPAVDCVINPYRVVDISSPVAGVIERLYVERSQPVADGQVIAQLEASVERANVDLARYRAGVESEIELGRVNINFDRLRKKRIESLLQESNVSRENADQIEREVQLSQWKLKQATELAEIRQLELRKAQVQLAQKSITAPFDGFVLDIFKYRGEYVEDQAIVRLAQLDPLVIEAIVPMENFGSIEPGMQADVMPEILLEERLRGEVIAVDRIGDTASNTFGVKLSIANPDNRIPAGLKCIAKFIDMPAEQYAAETDNPATEETSVPEVVKTGLTDTAPADSDTDESPGLLAVIGTANAAMAPEDKPFDVDRTIDKGAMQPINGKPVQAEEITSATSKKTPTTYMVMIELPKTKSAAEALVNRLRDAGEKNFLVYSKQGRISLGVFQEWATAEMRRQEVEDLGFTTLTRERYR